MLLCKTICTYVFLPLSVCLRGELVFTLPYRKNSQRVILQFSSVFIHRRLPSQRSTHLYLLVSSQYISRHISHSDKSCLVDMRVRSWIFPWMNHSGFHLWKEQISTTPDMLSCFIGPFSLSCCPFSHCFSLSFGMDIAGAVMLASRMQDSSVCVIKCTKKSKQYTLVLVPDRL